MAQTTIDEQARGRRVTIDLTPAAAAEVDRLRSLTGLTTADIFRHALSLFRIYIDGKRAGREIELVDPADSKPRTRIELPVSIQSPVSLPKAARKR